MGSWCMKWACTPGTIEAQTPSPMSLVKALIAKPAPGQHGRMAVGHSLSGGIGQGPDKKDLAYIYVCNAPRTVRAILPSEVGCLDILQHRIKSAPLPWQSSDIKSWWWLNICTYIYEIYIHIYIYVASTTHVDKWLGVLTRAWTGSWKVNISRKRYPVEFHHRVLQVPTCDT